MDCSFLAERAFGPVVSQCRRPFDFTLVFEELFFYLVPACIFLLGSIVEIYTLRGRTASRTSKVVLSAKIGAICCFIVLQTLSLILISLQHITSRTRLSIPAAVLNLCASLALLPFSYYSYARSIRPSFFITIYLALTLILRIAAVRTYWLIDGYGAIAGTACASLLVQAVVIVTESYNVRPQQPSNEHKISSEETASFLSRSLFIWINRLFLIGYRRPITLTDLTPVDSALSAAALSSKFQACLESSMVTHLALFRRTLRCMGSAVLAPVLSRLFLAAFTLAQPFLTTALINYFTPDSTASDNDGYGLIGATFLVYTGLALSTSWYWGLAHKSAVKARGGLSQVIFQKMMMLKSGKDIDSKVMTLMISDIERIEKAWVFIHEVWAAPMEIGLATWLLWRQVGPASMGVFALAIVCTSISLAIGKSVSKQQQTWLTACEARIAATKSILNSIKAIKMMGGGDKVGRVVEDLRTAEFIASKPFRISLTVTVIVSFIAMTLGPVVAFGMFVGISNASGAQFDASILFTSLILINIVSTPLNLIIQTIPTFGAALGCFTRIDKFLQTPTTSKKHLHEDPDYENDVSDEVTVLPEKVILDDKYFSGQRSKGPVISIHGASFGWGDEVLLKGVSLSINKGENVAIMGPVGSGKSLLIHAILREVSPLAGRIEVASTTIGYCSQSPWLENISVRDNAMRGLAGDEAWYRTVMKACALDEFLAEERSSMIIGSGAQKLSGGQKQRLALARAIAIRPAMLLLDDALSAVDRRTQKALTKSLFGSQGLCKKLGTTVVQVTQSWHIARAADRTLSVSADGSIEMIDIPFHVPIEQLDNFSEIESSPIDDSDTVDDLKGAPRKSKEEDMASDKSVYQTYLREIKRTDVAVFLIGAVVFSFTLKFPDIWVTWWSSATAEGTTQPIGYWLGLFSFLSALPLLAIGIWIGHTMIRIVPQSGVGLHTKLLRTVLDAPFTVLSTIDHGSVINRFNQDLMLVDATLPLNFINTACALLICIMQAVLVAVGGSLYLLAAFPVLILVLYFIQHLYLRTSKQLRHLELESKSGLHTIVSESWQGIVTIRAHAGWQRMIQLQFNERLNRSLEPLYLLFMVQTWLRLVLYLVVAGMAVTITGIAVATRHKTAASGIGLAFLNFVGFGDFLTHLIISWTSLETSLGAIARIQAFDKGTPREPPVEDAVQVPASWPASGSIQFQNVWSTYNSSAEEKNSWALRDLSFRVSAGERVAICGRTGSGKSSLLLTLLGLIDTPQGSILIDGIDVAHVPRSMLRSRIHVISQDAFIQGQDLSVRAALNDEHDLGDDFLKTVLRDCAVLDKIEAAGGLDAAMNGLNLSAGQAQLFILAQTILRVGQENGGVILFDEATSSVDPITEEKINTIMKEKLVNHTIISILHRLETALQFDRVLILEDGEVQSLGTPAEIVQESDLFRDFRTRESL